MTFLRQKTPRTSLPLRTGAVLIAAFCIAIAAAAAQAQQTSQSGVASGTPCHLRTSATPVPAGFGAPYAPYLPGNDQLLTVSCGGHGATFTAGDGSRTQYIYRYGYEHVDGAWKRFSFDGPVVGESWIRGEAKALLARTRTELGERNFVVAYVCAWHEGAWKCGCSDAACAEQSWQLQSFRHDVPDDAADDDITAEEGERVTLSLGESAEVGDLTLTLREITGDNRCPSGVQCVVAGSVKADILLEYHNFAEVRNVEQSAGAVTFQDFRIALVDAAPPAEEGEEIEEEDYELTFTVAAIDESVDIADRFDDKIVYGADADVDRTALQRHCAQEGGVFTTCASACPADADICTLQCVNACILDGPVHFEGELTRLNTDPIAVDGPAELTVKREWGATTEVRVSSGFGPACDRDAIDVDYDALREALEDGDEPTVAIRGEVAGEGNTVLICAENTSVELR